MGDITERKSKTKGTRYKAVVSIRREGIEYFDTETFSKSMAKKTRRQIRKESTLIVN